MLALCRYNTKNGGPAPEKLTDEVYENTKKISKYHIAGEALTVDIAKLGSSKFLVQHAHTGKFGNFVVEVLVPPVLASHGQDLF
jgi:phosphoglucomutase